VLLRVGGKSWHGKGIVTSGIMHLGGAVPARHLRQPARIRATTVAILRYKQASFFAPGGAGQPAQVTSVNVTVRRASLIV
jgi:hypothetical protein